MNPALISLINGVVLIAFGLWGYFGSDDPSPTAFIPVAFGAVLLTLNPGVWKKNKVVAHIAVVFTLLILLGLAMPLRGAISREDSAAIFRVAAMLVITLVAMVAFVKSFIDVRRAKAS